MNKWRFYPAAIILAIIALSLVCISRSKVAQATHLKANSIAAAVETHLQPTPDPEVSRLYDAAHISNWVGIGFALVGIASMVAAIARRERGFYSIPAAFLGFSIIMQSLLI